jgi:hypothetical protein
VIREGSVSGSSNDGVLCLVFPTLKDHSSKNANT